MRTFIYKRTHKGDPNAAGQFGIYNCMGRMRNAQFDAVIGIGGRGAEPTKQGIAEKVNWIGIGPKTMKKRSGRTIVTFDKFRLFEQSGIDVKEIAPKLAKRFFAGKNPPRFAFSDNLDDDELAEVEQLLDLVKQGRSAKAPIQSKTSQCQDGCNSKRSRCS